MAIAGRVAIVPKGEWSQDVTYDKLDLVTHNGNTFIAYKSSAGVEPVDGDTWMLVMQGIDPQDIENIIDGTTPVGDSNKLGGKGASEYALAQQIKDNSLWNELTEGFDLNNALGKYRAIDNTIILTLLNAPPSDLIGKYAEITVEWLPANSLNGYGMQNVRITQNASVEIWCRAKSGSTWCEWKKLATTADLANYLPIVGGNVGDGLYNSPLSITGDATYSFLQFLNNAKAFLGSLGFDTANKPVLQATDGTLYPILHSGNKPTGTYTGNGSATKRTIVTGGISEVILIKGNGCLTIVCGGVAFGGGINGFHKFDGQSIYSEIGVFYISSTDAALNESGVAYTYYVL